jgi:hypothetical protein
MVDDGEHIVLAIRIKKSTLQENHYFLAALSDAAVGGTAMPGAKDKALRRFAGALIAAKATSILLHPAALVVNWALTFVGLYL